MAGGSGPADAAVIPATPENEVPRLLVTVTHPITARFLMAGQLSRLRRAGFQVAVASAPGDDLDLVAEREGIQVLAVPMAREMSPLDDVASLIRMLSVVRRYRPQIVNAGTPKAGLLGMIAAWAAGVPTRIYTLRGLRLETAGGPSRRLLTMTEKVACGCAHHVVCVSDSLRNRAIDLGLVPESKAIVLGSGSSNGVDARRFQPRPAPEKARIRAELGIADGSPVVGFVGRFTRDKGIADLADGFFGPVLEQFPDARLLLIGDYEEGDPVAPEVRQRLEEDPRVISPGFVSDTAPYYGAMDVLAFPSHREGFPNAPLEAASSAVPVAGFAATGTVDAVVDQRTGILVPVRDRKGLASVLTRYLDDDALRRNHGKAGRERVEREFRQELVWQNWIDFYGSRLGEG